MTKPWQNWQGNTLHLPASLRLADCEAFALDGMTFPAAGVCVDASAVEQIDSIGVALCVWLSRQARTQNIVLNWQGVRPPLATLLNVYELNEGVL